MRSEGERGAVVRLVGRTKVLLYIDDELLEWFRAAVHEAGGGDYGDLINEALRQHVALHEGWASPDEEEP